MPNVEIYVSSPGSDVGDRAEFKVDGKTVDMAYGRGLNVIVLEQLIAAPMQTATFDTHASAQQADAFAALIEGLPVGRIVGIAAMDDASEKLTDRARRACQSLGSGLVYNLAYRSAWGLVGQKGAPLGSVPEALDDTMGLQFTARQLLPDPLHLSFRIRLWSAGFDVGNSFYIEVDGKRLPFYGQRGLNVAVFDTETCHLLFQHNYDTCGRKEASAEFIAMVNELPLGQFVAIAVKDDAALNLTAEARSAMEELGSGLIFQLGYRNSFAMVGQKGSMFGSACESLSASMPVACESWMSPRPLGWEGFSVSTFCASPTAGASCTTLVDGLPVGSLPAGDAGVLVMVIDEVTGAALQSATFDPANDPGASAAIASLLQSIPMGRIVVVSTNMGAVSKLKSEALFACRLIGSALVFNANADPHACWCILGRKGSPPGSVPECFGSCGTALQFWFLPDSPDRKRFFAALQVASAGYLSGNSASIAVNGHELANWQRGMNVAVIDPNTGAVLRIENYDTNASPSSSEQFAAMLEDLPQGHVVAIAVMDDAQKNLTERAKQACAEIGSDSIQTLAYRGSWAIVGVKGAPPGTVPECIGSSGCTSLVADQLFTIAARQNYGIQVMAESGGYRCGNFARIVVNGVPVAMAYGRGLNVVFIDRGTGEISGTFTFDTHESRDASDEFAAWLEAIAPGTLVAIAAKDDAAERLTDRAKRACMTIGSGQILGLGYRASWAIVGVKGSSMGAANESLNGGGQTAVQTWVVGWRPADEITPAGPPQASTFLGVGVVIVLAIGYYLDYFGVPPPVTRTTDPPSPPPPPGTRRALLVALDYRWKQSLSLERGGLSKNAIFLMTRTLINGGYFAAANIATLTDWPDKMMATKSNFKNALKTLLAGANPGDVVYLFFFGHGATVETSTGSKRECIVLLDDAGTGPVNFYDVELGAFIDKLPTKTNLTMLFNSCYSAGMADWEPYTPGRGILLAAVPRDVPAFWSEGFNFCFCKFLGNYKRQGTVPTYERLVKEIREFMIKNGVGNRLLPEIVCDGRLYDVKTLLLFQPIP